MKHKIINELLNVHPAVKGTGSLVAMKTLETIPTDPTIYMDGCKLLIQIVLGIATLISMFKKKNPPATPGDEIK